MLSFFCEAVLLAASKAPYPQGVRPLNQECDEASPRGITNYKGV